MIFDSNQTFYSQIEHFSHAFCLMDETNVCSGFERTDTKRLHVARFELGTSDVGCSSLAHFATKVERRRKVTGRAAFLVSRCRRSPPLNSTELPPLRAKLSTRSIEQWIRCPRLTPKDPGSTLSWRVHFFNGVEPPNRYHCVRDAQAAFHGKPRAADQLRVPAPR